MEVKMKTLRALTSLLFVASALSWTSSANAAWLAFDFDEDGDPATIRSEIVADVGDIVEGYLVLGGFPTEYEYFAAIQFGLEATSGLGFRGLAAVPDRSWGVLTDGMQGIVLALRNERVHQDDLPIFLLRFLFEVTDSGEQGVKVTPSTGWGHVYSDIVYVLYHEEERGAMYTVRSAWGIQTQIPAIVMARPTPIAETSWGAIKGLYAPVN
jgi:hypothetical protein